MEEKGIESIEKDYADGLLTEKGYKRKRLQVAIDTLDEDLKEGDITPLGHQRKKQKLVEEYGSVSIPGPSNTRYNSSSLASKVAGTHTPSMLLHTTLNKLFSKKKPQSSSLKKDKPITAMLIPKNMNVVPKNKQKQQLRAEGKIEMVYINSDDSHEDVKDKILKCFPNLTYGFDVLTSTKSGDLFIAKSPPDDVWTGSAIVELVGSGPLYITNRMATCVVSPMSSEDICASTTPPPAETTESQPLLIPDEELGDSLFFHLCESESLWHCGDTKEDNPQSEMTEELEPGKRFLDISLDVYHWSLTLDISDYPKEVGHFLLVEDYQLTDFLKFRDENPPEDSDNILLPHRVLLQAFCKENEIDYKTTLKNGVKFTYFPIKQVDSLCDWIIEKRTTSAI